MSKLAELKVLNCCPTRYSPGARDKAVDKRARLLQGEYRKKAKDTDRKYGGTEEGVIGPVENKLRQFGEIQGLVVGAFGEGSEDLHSLVQTIAESKVTAMGLSRGRQGTEAEVGVVVGQVRRMISTASVRAQAQCLLTRMSSVGEGVGQAAKRRQWAIQEDERMKQERYSQWMRRVEGVTSLRKGMIKTASLEKLDI